MYGGSAPSPEMAASMREHVYEQMKLVPKMQRALNFYDMSSDKIGSGIRTDARLLDQLRKMMDSERENFSLDTRMMTLSQRGRWARKRKNNNKHDNNAALGTKGTAKGNGGSGAPNLWKPTDILKDGA